MGARPRSSASLRSKVLRRGSSVPFPRTLRSFFLLSCKIARCCPLPRPPFAALLTLIPLLSQVAADCSPYQGDDPNAHWYKASEMKPNTNGEPRDPYKVYIYKLFDKYHGRHYEFNLTPSSNSVDFLSVRSDRGDDRQFMVTLVNSSGKILRAYWASKGTNCNHPTDVKTQDIDKIYVQERCWEKDWRKKCVKQIGAGA